MSPHRSMSRAVAALVLSACCGPLALAQSPEPAVDTSAPRAAEPAPAASAAPAPVDAAARAPAARRRPVDRAMDRIELEASQITGNRELPRVLYIVPWRAPEAGSLEGRPVNSLLFELTKPIDREVFGRENRYFDALSPGTGAGVPAVAPPPAGAPAPAEPAPTGETVRDTSQPRTPSRN